MRELQRLHQYYLKDIAFNFCIGDDGFVYEGRGFRHQGEIPSNTTTSSFGETGLIIAFIGNFTDTVPSQAQVETFQKFLLHSVRRDVIIRSYTLFLADQLTLKEEKFADGLLQVIKDEEQFYSSKFTLNIKVFKALTLVISVMKIDARTVWKALEPKKPPTMKFTAPINSLNLEVIEALYSCLNLVRKQTVQLSSSSCDLIKM